MDSYPKRFETTVPQQALFLMNNPFVVEQAVGLNNRDEIKRENDASKRIQALYRILFGRPARREEVALGRAYIAAETKGGDGPIVQARDWAYGYGRFDEKVQRIEELDAVMPRITALKPDVLIVTGDHSTPSLLREHSWHSVPILLAARTCRPDLVEQFGESDALRGGLGRFEAKHLMALALAHAGRLQKFGA